MLRFQDWRFAELMDIIVVVSLIVVTLNVLERCPLIPGEGEVLPLALEVVLHVALGAY